MAHIAYHFKTSQLPGNPKRKTALLLNPPVYDTQYWAEWAQPYGLLRIARLLEKLGYRRRELFDFMEASGEGRYAPSAHAVAGEQRRVAKRLARRCLLHSANGSQPCTTHNSATR